MVASMIQQYGPATIDVNMVPLFFPRSSCAVSQDGIYK